MSYNQQAFIDRQKRKLKNETNFFLGDEFIL